MGGSYKWPGVEDVVEYRRNVRNIILKLIADTPLQLPITMESPWVRLYACYLHCPLRNYYSVMLLLSLDDD
jgi:hypothetical protein